MKKGDKVVFNSMVQDIKELMWAGIVKECFLNVHETETWDIGFYLHSF